MTTKISTRNFTQQWKFEEKSKLEVSFKHKQTQHSHYSIDEQIMLVKVLSLLGEEGMKIKNSCNY